MHPSDDDDRPPVPREQLSKTPSWIMVGFVLGCLFAYVVNKELEKRRARETPPPAPVATAAPAPEISAPKVVTRLSLPEVDAIFRAHSDNAVWENSLTEIVMWNPVAKKFSEPVEVLRSGDDYYYRPLTRLTRPLITGRAEGGELILFTETESLRARRLEAIPPIFRPAPPRIEE